jgi:hypothetical protein
MLKAHTRFLVLVALFVCGGAALALAAEPLHYEPAVVRLRGIVELELRYGPPNYGENPETPDRGSAFG